MSRPRRPIRRHALRAVAVAAALVLLASCGAGDDDADGLPVVTVFGPYRGAEADLFVEGLEGWARDAGIDIRYTGTGDFVADLRHRVVDRSDPPDIALVPQPGLVSALFRDGRVLPLAPEVAEAAQAQFGPRALGLGTVDGALVGFPFRVNVKSLVWYRPSVFEALGLTIPASLDELESMVEQIEAAGSVPWCLGIEAQRSTGWAATDWVEDLVARLSGPDVYEAWTSGAIGFGDERVAAAFDGFRDLVLQPGRVAGGIPGVLRTDVQTASAPLFTDPAGCVLYRQASFALGWMPDDLELGPEGDIDFFPLPGSEPDVEPPVVVGADLAVAFVDRPEVWEVLAYLPTPAAGRPWAEHGGYVSPRLTVDPTWYDNAADRRVAELLFDAQTLLFDASDTMPPEIGSRLWWELITQWVAGGVDFDEMADALDAARTDTDPDAGGT